MTNGMRISANQGSLRGNWTWDYPGRASTVSALPTPERQEELLREVQAMREELAEMRAELSGEQEQEPSDAARDLARHLLFHAEKFPQAYDSMFGVNLLEKARALLEEHDREAESGEQFTLPF